MEKSQKIKCLIVDDEPIARKIIKNYINQILFLENSGECKNGIEALDFLSKDTQIQIVFLDINMPNLNGLTMAKIVKKNVIIIFTTAYSEFAVESYEVNAIDYLLKPFSFERFTIAVFKAIEKINITDVTEINDLKKIETKKIFIKSEGKNHYINSDEILYCEAMKNYTKIVLSDGISLKSLITFSKIEEDLKKINDDFLRIHRSFLISKKSITSVNSNFIFLEKQQIPIGPQYKSMVLKIIGIKE
jgi:DNA-binding LytR/AlgR family response regulator